VQHRGWPIGGAVTNFTIVARECRRGDLSAAAGWAHRNAPTALTAVLIIKIEGGLTGGDSYRQIFDQDGISNSTSQPRRSDKKYRQKRPSNDTARHRSRGGGVTRPINAAGMCDVMALTLLPEVRPRLGYNYIRLKQFAV
jgi:hypothetical protein